MVKVTLKGDVREYEAGTTIAEIAKSMEQVCIRQPALAKSTVRQ